MKLIDTPEDMLTRGSGARDYERIARAIEYLRVHATRQPDLAAVAT